MIANLSAIAAFHSYAARRQIDCRASVLKAVCEHVTAWQPQFGAFLLAAPFECYSQRHRVDSHVRNLPRSHAKGMGRGRGGSSIRLINRISSVRFCVGGMVAQSPTPASEPTNSSTQIGRPSRASSAAAARPWRSCAVIETFAFVSSADQNRWGLPLSCHRQAFAFGFGWRAPKIGVQPMVAVAPMSTSRRRVGSVAVQETRVAALAPEPLGSRRLAIRPGTPHRLVFPVLAGSAERRP
jgi:hypothetical protein